MSMGNTHNSIGEDFEADETHTIEVNEKPSIKYYY